MSETKTRPTLDSLRAVVKQKEQDAVRRELEREAREKAARIKRMNCPCDSSEKCGPAEYFDELLGMYMCAPCWNVTREFMK